ncbi:MAG: endolytic transglycosylase MltG [Oscillospiraceae bacterium]|nr:endolytic transglycosylase MltG [Oscillospiraceae bacterium]
MVNLKRCAALGCVLLLCAAAGCGKAKPSTTARATEESATQTAYATKNPGTIFVPPLPSTTARANVPAVATGGTQPVLVRIVIPEGFGFYQVAQRLEANQVCTAQAFYNAAQSYQVQSFEVPAPAQAAYRMEGFLFPDTYEFYQNDDPVAVLRKILNNYAAKSGLPDYNTLVLASIIEKETRSSQHMAMVSSVFHNRLSQGMRLQADATIRYAEQQLKPSALLQNTAQYAARYNTYKCDALPVGPICNPGTRALQAAQAPSRSDYLYYFFGGDSTNHYSRTYEDHQAAMAEYGLG